MALHKPYGDLCLSSVVLFYHRCSWPQPASTGCNFFPTTKLQRKGYGDYKMSPESPSTLGWVVNRWNLILGVSNQFNLITWCYFESFHLVSVYFLHILSGLIRKSSKVFHSPDKCTKQSPEMEDIFHKLFHRLLQIDPKDLSDALT